MKKKYKLTGCARFFVFMLIFVPVVWAGVSIYEGNNPLEPIQEFFKSDSKNGDSVDDARINEIDILKQDLKIKEARIEELEKEIKSLKTQLQSQ
jgi:hypothetical protein